MKASKWIEVQYENGIDLPTLLSKESFTEFCEKTGSAIQLKSYYRRVYEFAYDLGVSISKQKKSSETTEEDEANEPSYDEFSYDFIVEVLAEEIESKGKRLSLTDLKSIASERNIPYGAFFHFIPDLTALIKQLYTQHGFTLEEKKNLMKLRNEIKILKMENNNLLQNKMDIEGIVEAIHENSIPANRLDPIDFSPINFIRNDILTCNLILSDFHIGKIVSAEEVMGANMYNFNIATSRIDYLIEETIKSSKELGASNIHISLLGDMVEGIIQQDSLRNSETGIVGTIIALTDYLTMKIQQLDQYFDVITMSTVPGNHGRLLPGKPNFSNYADYNADQMAYEWLASQTKNIICDCKISKSVYHVNTINGLRILEHHGHNFGKGGNGYTPFPNAISKNIPKLNHIYESVGKSLSDLEESGNFGSFDYAIIGHFHVASETLAFDMTPVFLNGSLVGADEFSVGKLQRGEIPSQTLLFFSDSCVEYKKIIYINDLQEIYTNYVG